MNQSNFGSSSATVSSINSSGSANGSVRLFFVIFDRLRHLVARRSMSLGRRLASGVFGQLSLAPAIYGLVRRRLRQRPAAATGAASAGVGGTQSFRRRDVCGAALSGSLVTDDLHRRLSDSRFERLAIRQAKRPITTSARAAATRSAPRRSVNSTTVRPNISTITTIERESTPSATATRPCSFPLRPRSKNRRTRQVDNPKAQPQTDRQHHAGTA